MVTKKWWPSPLTSGNVSHHSKNGLKYLSGGGVDRFKIFPSLRLKTENKHTKTHEERETEKRPDLRALLRCFLLRVLHHCFWIK